MLRHYYDGYGQRISGDNRQDFGEVIVPKAIKSKDQCEEDEKKATKHCDMIEKKHDDCTPCKKTCDTFGGSFFGLEKIFPNFKIDDIILLGIIILLLHDGIEDNILIIVIAAIFLLGLNED